jgi:hypothetical protein
MLLVVGMWVVYYSKGDSETPCIWLWMCMRFCGRAHGGVGALPRGGVVRALT